MGKLTKCLIAMVFVIAFFAFTLSAISGAVDVPKTLNYQGNLTDSMGQPVTGSHQIIFNLYNAMSGGTSFWTETQTVQVVDGKFSVVLGKTTALDTTQFTGDTYLGLKVDNGTEMAPRQQFTSVAYALKAGSIFNMPETIPRGVVVMWTGAANEVPSGWALCDGTNGTPNLTDRFVIGAGNLYNPGDNAGSATKNLAHTHDYSGNTSYMTNFNGQRKSSPSYQDESNDNPDHNHSFSGTTASGGSSTQDVLPPYYALALIMKL
jgi:hypothetical protein